MIECRINTLSNYSRTFVAQASTHSKSGLKVLKDRCSILVGSNVSGTYKIKPVLIHYWENPRCLKNAGPLPVIYRNNKTAWMSGTIWRDWFYNSFVPSMRAFCQRNDLPFKILLLADNCPGHPFLEH